MSDLFYTPDLDELNNLLDDAKKRTSSGGKGDIKWYFLDEGEHTLVICPPYSKEGKMVKAVYTHYGLGDSTRESVVCPKLTYPDKDWECPMCMVIDLLLRQARVIGDDDSKKYVYRRQARPYYYFNVLVVDSPNKEKNGKPINYPLLPHVCKFSATVGSFIMEQLKKRGPSMFDLVEGAYPILVTREGMGTDTDYEKTLEPEQFKLDSEEEAKKIIEALFDIDLIFGKKWTKDAHTKSCLHANETMKKLRFQPLGPSRFPAYTEEMAEASKKKSASDKKDSKKSKKKDEDELEDISESLSGDTEEEQLEDLSEDDGDTEPEEEDEDAEPEREASGGNGEIDRDPNDIDPDTGKPRCFGHTDSSEICMSCDYQDICMVEALENA